MATLRSVALPTLATALIALSLAGCHSSASSTAGSSTPTGGTTAGSTPTAQVTTPPATTPATTPPATATAPATGPALGTLPAACPTAAEIASTLGVSTSDPGQTKTATTLDCAYSGSSALNTLSINFSTAKKVSAATGEAALKAQPGTSAKFQAVPGVGDAAFYDSPTTGGSYIAVISGGLIFHVVSGGSIAPSKYAALAQAILAG